LAGHRVFGSEDGVSEFQARRGADALNLPGGVPLEPVLNALTGGRSGADGIAALVERLRAGGLGQAVESWIGTGSNQQVAPAALEQALGGAEEARRLAGVAGLDAPALLTLLSVVLPRMLGALSPQGRLPTQEEMPEGGLLAVLASVTGRIGGAGTGSTG
jgi:uncharacterized protein YidB (DUF937 family)